MRQFFKKYSRFLIIPIGIVLLVIPQITSDYVSYVIQRGVQNAILVLGLVMLLGYSGMMSLGSAALMAIGGYAYGIVCVNFGISPWIAAALAVVIATLFGTMLAFPSFKLSGAFLTVTTIGFGEIVRILLLNLQSITGGAYGMSGFPALIGGGWAFHLVMVAALVLVTLAVNRIGNSRLGLALKAVRQDQVAAEVMGVDVKRAKLVVYALYALLSGLSGVFYASLTGYLSPDSFTMAESITPLLMVVMGGMSQPTGAVVSSVALTSLPEVLRFLLESRLMVYSLVLLVYIRVKAVPPKWMLALGGMLKKCGRTGSQPKIRNGK